jgi:HK97 family phage major capsid protein
MASLTEMKLEAKATLEAADAIIKSAEQHGGQMTKAEEENYNARMANYNSLRATIKGREEQNTIRRLFNNGTPFPGPLADQPTPAGFMQPFTPALHPAETCGLEYREALHTYLKSGGKTASTDLGAGADGGGGFYIPGSEMYTRQRRPNGKYQSPRMGANMYEGTEGGSDSAGGYAITVPTETLIVPLAVPDLGIFDASLVIPTSTDLKIPVQTAFGTAALKTESGTTVATFGGNDPTLGQFALQSFMAGAIRWVSWELMQDVPTFQSFIVDDLLKAQRILEGSLLASGTGTGQAQGVFGNTGTGTGSAYELLGTSADSQTLLNSLFDVTSTLKGPYQPNAVWIMSRATGLAVRKAQMDVNLFVPVATVDPDGTERILGKPVFYDVNAPALPTATSSGVVPILYGDFKAGYIIGVRGGSGINVKVLDQPNAVQGQLGLLAYRRLDGRVRRSEAIQAVTISHS